jgi:uncharacterized protein (TIGR03067 family)
MRRTLFLIVAAGLLVAADDPKKEDAPKKEDLIKKELAKFQGTWIVVSVEDKDGKRTAEDLGVIKLTIKDNKFTLTVDGKVEAAGTFKIDPTKKPKTVDTTHTEGVLKGETTLGIYELNGDTRKGCHNLPRKDRPKEFTVKGSCAIFVYKREKAK